MQDYTATSVCTICSEDFPSRNALFRHLRRHIADAQPDFMISSLPAIDAVRTHYEDDFIKVVVKPQGLPTMGSRGEKTLHASDALMLLSPQQSYCSRKYKKAVPVHRLDRLTGGFVVCSKSKLVETFLKQCFENKVVQKRYRALCPGEIVLREGNIEVPIDGRTSLTRYRVVMVTRSRKFEWLSTVDLWPVSGRRHQLYVTLPSN